MNNNPVQTLLIACLLDAALGDPRSVPHPVQAIGKLISFLEDRLYDADATSKKQTASGGLLFLSTIAATFISAHLLAHIPIVRLYFLQAALAERSLLDAGTEIAHGLERSLKTGELEGSQKVLSQYVGRDTTGFSSQQIAKAGVETLAENTSDAFVVPLFWMAVGTLFNKPLEFVWVYKAVSTLDSMVAYKNTRYLYFGRASAKADDLLAYIPARITGFYTVLASSFLGLDAKKSFDVLLSDGQKHDSPNAGISEAAFAGALDCELGGPAYYSGKLVEHPRINSGAKQVGLSDLRRARRLSKTTAIISAIAIIGLSAIITSKLKED